jgi:2-dehydropantoate 2-reductase
VKVAVLGAGAIGAYVGAALARGGTEVHLVARGAHLEAMRAHGVQILSPRGDFVVHPHATDDPDDIGPVDVVPSGSPIEKRVPSTCRITPGRSSSVEL